MIIIKSVNIILYFQVTRLCDLSPDTNTVTSVSWNERGNLVAVGTHHGYVAVWDMAANKQVRYIPQINTEHTSTSFHQR